MCWFFVGSLGRGRRCTRSSFIPMFAKSLFSENVSNESTQCTKRSTKIVDPAAAFTKRNAGESKQLTISVCNSWLRPSSRMNPALRTSPPAASTSTQSLPTISTTAAVGELPQYRRASTRARDSVAALAAVEKALLKDPKYNKYAQSVERTLQSFDNVNEWADFITFLAKLLKVIPPFQIRSSFLNLELR